MPQRSYLKVHERAKKKLRKALENMKNGYYSQTERQLKQLLHIQHDYANGLYLYAVCLQKNGQTEIGRQMKEKSIELNPCYYKTFSQNYVNVAKNILQNLKDTKSNKELEDASTMTWVDTLNVYSKHMDFDSCLKVMKLWQKIKKPDSEYTSYIFSNFGITYYELGFYQESYAKYQSAIAKTADEFRYYNNSAILCYILGEYQKGEEFVQKSLQLKPNYAKSLFIVSFSLVKMEGRTKQALDRIVEASKITPHSIQYRLKIITILLTYFPDQHEEVSKQLKEVQSIIDGNEDQDSYFYSQINKPLLEEATKFMMDNYKEAELVKPDWQEYVQLMDDYLIRGHYDKYRITKKMNKLKQQMDIQLVSIKKGGSPLPDELNQVVA